MNEHNIREEIKAKLQQIDLTILKMAMELAIQEFPNKSEDEKLEIASTISILASNILRKLSSFSKDENGVIKVTFDGIEVTLPICC